MAKAKKEVATKQTPIQSHMSGDAVKSRVRSATAKAKSNSKKSGGVNASAARESELRASFSAISNAESVLGVATQSAQDVRLAAYTICQQSYGANWFKNKTLANNPRKMFVEEHLKAQGIKGVTVSINEKRNELKIDTEDEKTVKLFGDARTYWNRFVALCERVAGAGGVEKFKKAQSDTKRGNARSQRTLQEQVADFGQRLYNAFYKEGKTEDAKTIKAICAKYKHICTVPAGAK